MPKINGEYAAEAAGITVKEYLLSKGYSLSFIAVELNGNILPKPQYESYVIKEDDKLEVVTFVGGG